MSQMFAILVTKIPRNDAPGAEVAERLLYNTNAWLGYFVPVYFHDATHNQA